MPISARDVAFSIRRATPDDADAIIDVVAAVAAEDRWIRTSLPFDAQAATRNFRDRLSNDLVVSFVAETQDGVVGEASMYLSEQHAHLGMVVSLPWRRRGIGRALLRALEAYAREQCISEIGLDVYGHNEAAIALYRSTGFIEVGQRAIEIRPDGQRWTIVPMQKTVTNT
jgi:ribosomal protein S18 acetylase RimI-like enzyme